jgi:hypothetical protein
MTRRFMVPTAMMLLGGLILVACSSGSSSSTTSAPAKSTTTQPTTTQPTTTQSTTKTSSSGSEGTTSIQAVESRISRSSNATFSVTYVTQNAGKSQTITFAQAPPKEAVITSSGSFYIDGSKIITCQGTGSTPTCTQLPASLAGSADALTRLFSPGVLTSTLKGIEAQVDAHLAGVSLTTSSAKYAGLDSTCITVKAPTNPAPIKYCAADSAGILTYFSAGGNSGMLTAYSPNPPASTFSPPAGTTVQTLPSGTP